jgi:hypothetical protein
LSEKDQLGDCGGPFIRGDKLLLDPRQQITAHDFSDILEK